MNIIFCYITYAIYRYDTLAIAASMYHYSLPPLLHPRQVFDTVTVRVLITVPHPAVSHPILVGFGWFLVEAIRLDITKSSVLHTPYYDVAIY